MFRKTLAAVAVAGALVLMGASAASAQDYPADVACTAAPSTIAPGQTSVVTCTGFDANTPATFTVTGPGVTDATLSSFALAPATGTDTLVRNTDASGTVKVNFLGPNVTSSTGFDVSVTAVIGDETASVGTTVTVAPAGTPGTGLPATGGTVPAAAIWLGVGAIGIGSIAVVAAVARRRAAHNR